MDQTWAFTVEAWSPKHWTTRWFPSIPYLYSDEPTRYFQGLGRQEVAGSFCHIHIMYLRCLTLNKYEFASHFEISCHCNIHHRAVGQSNPLQMFLESLVSPISCHSQYVKIPASSYLILKTRNQMNPQGWGIGSLRVSGCVIQCDHY